MSAMPRGRPPLDGARVWVLHKQGVAIPDIAARLGYHRRTVAQAIQLERERRTEMHPIPQAITPQV